MPDEARKPRETKIHKQRRAVIEAALTRLGSRQDYHQAIQDGALAIIQQDQDAGKAAAQTLLTLVCETEPDFARLMGREEMFNLLGSMMTAQAGVLLYPAVPDEALLPITLEFTPAFIATERISPDNDQIKILPGGGAVVKPTATKADIVELGQYRSSFDPTGRPSGTKDRNPRKQKHAIEAGMAGSAYAALDGGAKQEDVIRAIWPDLDETTSYARRKLRKLIKHIVAERGKPRRQN